MHNRLADETSPYLLQHADNPVHWQPWDETALEQARREERPILLSIGYSACHWCHVMAHESFEDPGTAELMNALYVSIKVDREERPDLDHIYQMAHQLLTGRPGGWPLTVFLKPDDHVPIFSGTYFPKNEYQGMPAFATVLTRVEQYYRENATEIAKHGALVADAFRRLGAPVEAATSTRSREPLERAREQLGESADAVNGGFGNAPKFPHPTNLDFLLRYWQRSLGEPVPDEAAREIVMRSLTRMARGGLYDQLGGGFFRYSVDAEWSVPHFEKMLYDNAALLALFSDAWAATREPLFARVASETAGWIRGDMEHADGGYFATRDADSEGEEGKYYLWTRAELEAALEAPERAVAAAYFGLDAPANFEGRAWHLHAAAPAETVAERLGHGTDEVRAHIASARKKLLAERNKRVPPERDEKRLVAWNGLTIRALARASRRLGQPELADSATRAVEFIATELWDGERLRACFKDGRARFEAYLDDYAFLAAGLVELLQCRWRAGDLELATALLETLLEHFEDPNGGFFFVADDHEALIHRPKLFADEAVPSGNGMAASTLLALGHLLGETRYLEAAQRTLAAAMASIERAPQAHATLLEALDHAIEPPELVVVRTRESDAADWRAAAEREFSPRRLAFFIPAEEAGLPALLAERRPAEQTIAYVCHGTACDAPATDLETFESQLRRRPARAG